MIRRRCARASEVRFYHSSIRSAAINLPRMFWILLLVSPLLAWGAWRALLGLVALLPGRGVGVPRPAHPIELAFGVAAALAALAWTLPSWLDPAEPGPLRTLTGAAVGILILAGALIAGGPRGRARLATVLFDSNRRYVGLRTYVRTREKTERLRALGRAPAMAAVLLVGAVACFAKPFVTPYVEPARVPSLGSDDMPLERLRAGLDSPAQRAAFEEAAAGGHALAIDLLSRIGGSARPRHFTLEGYDAERNLAWPLSGAVLALLGLGLVLSAGGLAEPLSPPVDARADGPLHRRAAA